jgi:alkylation response protein AidB-like acyl-CoA dehydrogenase
VTRARAEVRPEIEDLLEVVRRLCDEVIAPSAGEIDRTDAFPHDLYARFSEMGLVGLLVPEELGGAGGTLVEMSLLYEELAKASASCSLLLSNSIETLVPIAKMANEELRDEALGRVLGGGEVPCFCLTEPEAGSDATALRTTAVSDGGDWVIRGRKQFITNGSVGSLFLVFALTDPEERKSRRLSAFVVDRDAPGFSIGKDEETMGTRGSPLTELVFDGVRVPGTRLVGERGEGLKAAMLMLNESRVGAAAQCVGIGVDALERSLAYSAERQQFGRPIGQFQAVQLLLADMAIRNEASRALTLAAAAAHDRDDPDAVMLSAMCKTLASDAAVQTALDAIQVHGGYGYCRDFGIERLLRDAKAFQIFDGTNQIQRLTVAKALQGRSPAGRRRNGLR